MGTINYGTSYYFTNANGKREFVKDITIGLKPTSDYDDKESGYAEWLEGQKELNEDFEESDNDRSEYDNEHDSLIYEDVKNFLESTVTPDHYSISLTSGYYEGFYLVIENDIPWVFDDSKEKSEYLKDITVLKNTLTKLVKEYGLTVVHPGWCTGYTDEKGAMKEINEFIKNLREEVKSVDTFSTYKKKHSAA